MKKNNFVLSSISAILIFIQIFFVKTLTFSAFFIIAAFLGFSNIISLTFLLIDSIGSKIKTINFNLKDFAELFTNNQNQQKNSGLRILVFNWRDTKHMWAGGAEKYIHEFSKQWVINGNSVTVFCGNDQKNPRNERIDGISIVRRGGFYTVYIWAVLYSIFKFRNNYDLIIDSENGIPFFTPLFTTKPVILLIHHVHQEIFIEHLRFPFSLIAQLIEGRIMPLVYKNKTVVTVSESSKIEIIKSKIAVDSQIKVINPGIESPKVIFRKTKYPSIIYLGRLKAYKNVDVAINAFNLLVEKIDKARFFIVGEGDSFDDLKALSVKLKLNKKIHFYGHVSEEAKNKLLSKSWVAIQPSQVEGWGITVLEANACKTPVVASNTKGLRDSILNNKTGVLVKLGDTKSFAKELMSLIKNSNKRDVMSEESFKWSTNFSWEKSAKNFYDFAILEATRNNQSLSLQRISYLYNRFISLF